MVCSCTLIDVIYKRFSFCKVHLVYYILVVTIVRFCSIYFSFTPTICLSGTWEFGMWIPWMYLMSIFKRRKGGSLQLVSELRLSEYLGNGGVKLIRDGVRNALEWVWAYIYKSAYLLVLQKCFILGWFICSIICYSPRLWDYVLF